MAMTASRPSVNSSALHIFEILRLVSAAEKPPGVAEISRRLDLPTSTVHRALATLEQSGYLARLESAPRYRLGPMPQFLTRAIFRQFPLRSASLPFLKEIAQETGATTSLGVRIGFYYTRIALAYGDNDIFLPGRLGEIKLLHDGLCGRGILAFMGAKAIGAYRQYIQDQHPKRQQELVAQNALLRSSRENGFVAEQSDHLPGAFALSLPICDVDGVAVAAIQATGPVKTRSGSMLRPAWSRHADDLQKLVGAQPELLRSPYAHLDPKQIVIRA
jgi:DNA-binding IclR family transcriptional regulator